MQFILQVQKNQVFDRIGSFSFLSANDIRELEGKMDQDEVYFSHLIQSQNRAEIAKSYYFILGKKKKK